MTLNNIINKTIFWKRALSFLLFFCVLFVALYGYFVSTSIINVLVRKEIERDTAVISSQVSELETRYLSLKNEITLTYASNNGFYAVEEKYFAVRTSGLAGGLTLNSD